MLALALRNHDTRRYRLTTLHPSDPKLTGKREAPRKRRGIPFADVCWNCGDYHTRAVPCFTVFNTRKPQHTAKPGQWVTIDSTKAHIPTVIDCRHTAASVSPEAPMSTTIVVCDWCEKPMAEADAPSGVYCSSTCRTTAAITLITKGEGELEDVAWLVKQLAPHQLARVRHVDEVDLASKRVTYIGRANGKRKLAASKWQNPIPLDPAKVWDPAERKACLRAFVEYLLDPKQAQLLAQLGELEGQTLACFCRDHTHPDALCHGLVLLALAEADAIWF